MLYHFFPFYFKVINVTGSPIQAQITDDMKAAMRAKEKQRLGVIRLMQAEFKRIEVDERIELDDPRVLTILDKMVKQRRDSIKQYEAANRPELAEQEAFEITVIQQYLPAQLNEEEILELIESALSESGASSMQEMGKVMNRAEEAAEDRILDVLLRPSRGDADGDNEDQQSSTRQLFRKKLREGELDDKEIEIEISKKEVNCRNMFVKGVN